MEIKSCFCLEDCEGIEVPEGALGRIFDVATERENIGRLKGELALSLIKNKSVNIGDIYGLVANETASFKQKALNVLYELLEIAEDAEGNACGEGDEYGSFGEQNGCGSGADFGEENAGGRGADFGEDSRGGSGAWFVEEDGSVSWADFRWQNQEGEKVVPEEKSSDGRDAESGGFYEKSPFYCLALNPQNREFFEHKYREVLEIFVVLIQHSDSSEQLAEALYKLYFLQVLLVCGRVNLREMALDLFKNYAEPCEKDKKQFEEFRKNPVGFLSALQIPNYVFKVLLSECEGLSISAYMKAEDWICGRC